ncbi:hypothetical protein A3I99_04305 [Candidatus Kaiserbacteria bacterium RIFCSPLOWO2_02_FULL_45_11b]|uniref:Uncharacterized protein n=1 Tax=Candidatus Kaiserbacteria bacterium RIFCSPLOWO2_12_FULL_45_26 TaxID=1798525 RepID=A0A1F6FHF9_9BACT|nr:MAG: hypothetical protein A2929_03520 [Candidatus Kaiserbacteria bacterium RIFCSPLOWO2_01_FULL_45_25]OGG83803.1 MAG: hypothetical protein A3I99_04305 [Candidatus Kaiserbacteria bacterium RIFCSPLOWO2_02_FULL_45_11b]OGG85300.1 MAG: hypothetical protein A3G90_04580 [Candidatus Kaiserbacteria bacterium RIFCSPLOWO2_12_FULL_45_26]
MNKFAWANLALVILYSVFEWRDIAPTGHGFLGGIALAYLFSNADKIMRSKAWPLLIIGTLLVESLLYYGYWQNSELSDHLPFAIASSVFLGSVFAAFMALRFKRGSDFIHVEVLVALAVVLNSLFLVSYLYNLLFK